VSELIVRLAHDNITLHLDERERVIPIGPTMLTSREFASDPPRPEELTNAIGAVVDHLDDVLMEWPAAAAAETVHVIGDLPTIIAAVEVGGPPPAPFRLSRAAAEDVFRTLATETAPARAHNPGLPAAAVETIVAACCIVVALIRHLHLDAVVIGEPS
jgi:exopolyphosphatase / guanosine-5'-triphosphate,3'-diphosphate pyrophosphatase